MNELQQNIREKRHGKPTKEVRLLQDSVIVYTARIRLRLLTNWSPSLDSDMTPVTIICLEICKRTFEGAKSEGCTLSTF